MLQSGYKQLVTVACVSGALLTLLYWTHYSFKRDYGTKSTPGADFSPVSTIPKPTMIEHPIATSDSPVYLDGSEWQASLAGGPAWLAAKGPLTATVPGDILTDLQNAGVVGDPYFNVTWRDPKFIEAWNSGVWTYTRRFEATPAMLAASETLLVFDGIRMGATVRLNGKVLGNVTDQFLRMEYSVGKDLAKHNVLTVSFHKDIQCGGRYTYSNQIDWAPNFITHDPTQNDFVDAQQIKGRETFGFGIWKSVYLVPVQSAAIMQFVPHIFYAGGHPTSMIEDENHAGFEIKARVILWALGPTGGQVSVNVLNVAETSRYIKLDAGMNTINLTIPARYTQNVKLWQPHGHGSQPRYNITASFAPSGGASVQNMTTWRLLGFRHVALVTINDTSPEQVAAAETQEGSGQFGMFFRINGAPVFARGGNKIVMDLIDGRLTAENHHRLVQTAVEGNMNMLRIWGGGIWEPRAFFDACDELGVLLYADMQFTWGSINEPFATSETVRQELIYQLQRISHHPSVVNLDEANEVGGGLYDTWVMPIVASVDQSRPVWPGSPSGGWVTGVNRLTGRANGNAFAWIPQNGIEAHGPYNGLGPLAGKLHEGDVNARCDPSVVPNVKPANTGVKFNNLFHSEFGCVAFSSFESMSAQLPPDQWGLHSEAAGYRNWPVDIVVKSFFGEQQDLTAIGEAPFKKQLYQSLIGQLLFMKKEIEEWRAGNIFGSLFWMYNEIWPTGGWGSVEYGSGTAGQVPGGRWKPFHYALKATTFADQLATCTTDASCFIKNDSPFEFKGHLKGILMNMLTGASSLLISRPLSLEAGPGITDWFCVKAADGLQALVSTESGLASKYTGYPGLIPGDVWSGNEKPGTREECDKICDDDSHCVGYTVADDKQPTACYFYSEATNLVYRAGATWYQKPGHPPLPGPPPPPQPLRCTPWAQLAEWQVMGCDADGANCLLTLEVSTQSGGTSISSKLEKLVVRRLKGTAADAKTASFNVLPFQPPLKMRLSKANVTVTIEEPIGDRVPLKLSSTATALYVTLTTKAAGRFSDNAFLLTAGTTTVDFLPWGTYGSKEHELLKSSLRVEHLAENL